MRFAAMANIFLLEDDKILSKGISIALKKDEHMVTAVYGYLEALKQYQKQKYDLFLLDINLPDGNGLEFCEKIRETSETPVLFLTANDTEEGFHRIFPCSRLSRKHDGTCSIVDGIGDVCCLGSGRSRIFHHGIERRPMPMHRKQVFCQQRM